MKQGRQKRPEVAFAFALIALVQFDSDRDFGNPEKLRQREVAHAQAAVDQGAKVVVFPEGSSTGYATRDRVWCTSGSGRCGGRSCVDVGKVAEPVPAGPSTRFWAKWAQQRGVYVVFWVPERDGPDYFNTLVAVGPQGFVSRYRKRDLYYLDQCWAEAGRESVVLRTPHGNFGLMVCMDGADYPGTFYADYRNQGVDAILLSMDWDDDPAGPNAALPVFRRQAKRQKLPIFAADAPAWDGTGMFPETGAQRNRSGLPEPGVGIEGIALVPAPASR